MSTFSHLTASDIQRLLSTQENTAEEGFLSAFLPDAARPAAVLVPLLRAQDDDSRNMTWHVLLTRRSDQLEEHRGQVAFPGGRSEPTDLSPETTALREAQEEIGLDPHVVRVLGKLNSMLTITNYRVSPVVGVIPWPYHLNLADNEVDRVFTIPLDWLADPKNYEIRHQVIPPPYALHFGSDRHPVIYFQPYKDEILWGVSAEITRRLLKLLTA